MALNGEPVGGFRTWQYGYGGRQVFVYRAGTTALAQLYSDPALTAEVDNPQTLETLMVNNVSYGRFAIPLYVGEAYYWRVGNETSGVFRPGLVSVDGEDISNSLVRTRRGGYLRATQDMLDNVVYAADFGEIRLAGDLQASPATNTETVRAAIGAAGALGGGAVFLPGGAIEITTLSVPQNVILYGQGRGATILQSAQGQAVITFTGSGAGLADLTLDGINLIPSSIGVLMTGVDQTVFRHVEIKRFVIGIQARGGRGAEWTELDVSNCQTGCQLRGDEDLVNGGFGDEWAENSWIGGTVQQCTTNGIQLTYEDMQVRANTFTGIRFLFNSGNAILLNGARFITFEQCSWHSNISNVEIQDDDVVLPLAKLLDNKTASITIRGGLMDGGNFPVSGRAQDIVVDRVELLDVAFVLTSPQFPVQLIDTIEDAEVTISGDTIKLQRWRRNDRGEIVGRTVDATTLTAWEHTFNPGEVCLAIAEVTAVQRNGSFYGTFYVACGARREGSTLGYDGQVTNFTLGRTLKGATSGATGLIIADFDSGATGTLSLRSIVGEFTDNEVIRDDVGGSAVANGVLVPGTVSKDGIGDTQLRPKYTPLFALNYDAQTAGFTRGALLTGGTSGATAKIERDIDNGTTGTLILSGIGGTFQDNEVITDAGGGSADADGTTTANAGYTAAFFASGGSLQLRVTGLPDHQIDWTVRVDLFAGK